MRAGGSGRVQNAIGQRLQIAPLLVGESDVAFVSQIDVSGDRDVLAAVDAPPAHERAAIHARIAEDRDYTAPDSGSAQRGHQCAQGLGPGLRGPSIYGARGNLWQDGRHDLLGKPPHLRGLVKRGETQNQPRGP